MMPAYSAGGYARMFAKSKSSVTQDSNFGPSLDRYR